MKVAADEVPLGVVTVTLAVPAVPAGAVAVIRVDELTWKPAAVVPKLTAVAPVKLVPMMVTTVPPEAEPLDGLRLVIVGAEAAV